MKGRESYYSLIQYCPDRFRAESANVGILVFTPEVPLLRAKVTANGKRARAMFRVDADESRRICRAAKAVADRVERSGDDVVTLDELRKFIDTRANDIRITDPRLVKIEDIDTDLDRLFHELVEHDKEDAVAHQVRSLNLIDQVFDRLLEQQRAFRPDAVVVPVLGKTLDVPYAYRNGVLNLVKPEKFSKTLDRAVDQASVLAIDGDLLHDNPQDGVERQLIVVSAAKPTAPRRKTENRLRELFNRYNVRFVPSDDVQTFAQEVEASAHG